MNRLSTLGALIAGAILLAAFYGVAFGGRDAGIDIEINDDEGVRHVVSGDRGSFALKKDGLDLEASWRGDYDLTEGGDDLASLEHKLDITRKQAEREEQVVFERDGDDVESIYYLDGEKQDENPETAAAKKALLIAFLEASGAKAEDRVAILLREGGVKAVLERIDAMYSDHARLRYITELTDQTDLTNAETSDLLKSLKNIEGDHDLRVALDALLQNETVDAAEMPLFLETASRIESDYDLRRLIERVSENELNDDALTLAIELMKRLESDHDLRRASEALLGQDKISEAAAARLLDTIGDRIESDHDLRLILGDAAPFLARGGDAARAWVGAFNALDSDHDQRLTLEEAAGVRGLSVETRLALIAASENIESDHDRRLALEAYSDLLEGDEALEAAYKKSADGIGSESDRERALEAANLDN
ncbi:hypothetical protein [Hyphococcus sp.]|uniref:hypothetical protein n=1 Tax=Hyphococcus sp. TaxID=2038636 RepID=UPI003D0E716D